MSEFWRWTSLRCDMIAEIRRERVYVCLCVHTCMCVCLCVWAYVHLEEALYFGMTRPTLLVNTLKSFKNTHTTMLSVKFKTANALWYCSRRADALAQWGARTKHRIEDSNQSFGESRRDQSISRGQQLRLFQKSATGQLWAYIDWHRCHKPLKSIRLKFHPPYIFFGEILSCSPSEQLIIFNAFLGYTLTWFLSFDFWVGT